MSSRRPGSLTIIALLLAWLSLGGFAIAIWASAIESRATVRAAFAFVGLWYGISALGAAAGVWRMRLWALPLLISWLIATLASVWLPQFLNLNQPPLALGVAGTVLVGGILVPLVVFVRKQLQSGAAQAT